MNFFRNLFARSGQIGRSAKHFRRLNLEPLEQRTVLSTSVVPLGQNSDGVSTFHLLQDAVNAATAAGSTITIEPGATADLNPVTVNTTGLTITGDPNVSGSILPSYTIVVNAPNVTLTRLTLGTVTINPDFSGDSVTHSTVNTIDVNGGTSGDGTTLIDQNTITGSVSVVGFVNNPMTNVNVTNNTFNTFVPISTGPLINLQDVSNGLVQNNNITGGGSSPQIGIEVTRGLNNLIANNTIHLTGQDLNTDGIIVENPGFNSLTTIAIRNNTIATGQGRGLYINAFNDATMQASVQGNDFHGNAIGIEYLGSNSGAIATDLGGGGNTLGSSLGGNDFRGFPAQGTASNAAIVLRNVASTGILAAHDNIFANPTTAQQTVVTATGTGTIDVSQPLDANHAYVQTLFNELLGRTGTMSDLNYWVNVLTLSPAGRANVANGVARSTEGLNHVINSYYLQYLGRPADNVGLTYWVNQINKGATLEEVQAAILSSQEFLNENNSNYIQAVYLTELGRTAGSTDLAFWEGKLTSEGFSSVSLGITTSPEYRKDFITLVYENYLHRMPTSGDLAYWTAQPGDLLTLETQVLTSNEFFTNG